MRGSLRPASATRASFARKRRIAIPASTSSWKVLDAGGKDSDRGRRAPLRLFELTDKKESPYFKITRVSGVQ